MAPLYAAPEAWEADFARLDEVAAPVLALQGKLDSAEAVARLMAVETVLDDIPALALTEAEARQICNGQRIALAPVASRHPEGVASADAEVRLMNGDRLVALARIEAGIICPFRVLNS